MRNINFEAPPLDEEAVKKAEKEASELHAKKRMGGVLIEKDGKLQRLDGEKIENGEAGA